MTVDTTITPFDAAAQEISSLLLGNEPSDTPLDVFGEYTQAVESLRETRADWLKYSAKLQDPTITPEKHSLFLRMLDELGSAVSLTEAVRADWEKWRTFPSFAGLDLIINQAFATLRQQNGQQLTLAQILTALAQTTDVIGVKQILRDVTPDAANLNTRDLLTLIDTVQHRFGVPQTWLKDWQRLIKDASQPAATAAGGNGAQPPTSTPGAAPTPGVLPPHIQKLIDANLTDSGNGECLAYQYGDFLRYCDSLPKGRKWLWWDGQRWQLDETQYAVRLALATARARYHAAAHVQDMHQREALGKWAMSSENVAKLQNMLVTASAIAPFATKIEQYDADPFLCATQTGTLDLRTQNVHPPDRSDYLTMQLGAAYDPNATCPRWLQFLDEVFQGDQDLIKYIQRAVGYTLTGDTREQCMFLCFGGGANGKSVLLHILAELLGDYGANAGFETFDAGQRPGVGEYLAMLRGKRYVTIIETSEDRRLDEAKVKAVTAGDPVTCRYLHANPFTYKPVCKIWFAMNHKPVIRGTEPGIWRRIRLIPFLADFQGREDKQLESKLRAELPGILNWVLEGLADWQQNGLGTCAAIEAATAEYKQESDIVGLWREDETETTNDPDDHMLSDDGYTNFEEWCKRRGDRFPMGAVAWGRRMGEAGFKSKRMKVVTGNSYKWRTAYLGIKLLP